MCSPERPNHFWGPPNLLLNWHKLSSYRTQRPGREVDHKLLPRAGVKSEWSYTSVSPVYLNGVQKENVTVFHIFWFALCLLFNTQLGLIGSNEKGRRVKLRIARNCIIPVLLVRPSFLVATFHDLTAKVTCSSYYA